MNILYELICKHMVWEIIGVIVTTLIAVYVVKHLLEYIHKKTKGNDWIQTFTGAFFGPSRWMIFIFGIITIFGILLRDNRTFGGQLLRIRYLFIVSSITLILFRWKNNLEKILISKFARSSSRRADKALFSVVSKLVSILLIFFMITAVLDSLGVPLQALFAFGGVSGIAISWAAKDVVANFFGGLMIYINRPFLMGDWIKSPNKGFEGVVEEIGWYMTRIRTFERRPMFIPNALITDAIVENPGRMYNRRIKTLIGIRYADVGSMKAVVDGIRTMFKSHPDIDQDQVILVHFIQYGEYSLDIEVYAFTKTTQWQRYLEVQQDVFLKINDVIAAHKAEVAFPTRVIHVQKDGSL